MMEVNDNMPVGTIHVDGLRCFARHGVFPQERAAGNVFEVTLALKVYAGAAMTDDSLDATVNYAEIVDTVREVMAQPSALLENVAWRIKEALTRRFDRIAGGSVAVYKLQPPISAELGRVGFSFSW